MAIMTFGQCLKSLMEAHRLSVSTLVQKSGGTRAELRHALADELSSAKRNALAKKLCACGIFSQEERQSLKQALQVSEVGRERYAVFDAVERLLMNGTAEEDASVRLADGSWLQARLAELMAFEKIEILCINCNIPGVVKALEPFFADEDRDVRMRHYVQMDYCGSAAEMILCVSPILFDPRYMPFAIQPTAPTTASDYAFGGNYLSVKAVSPHKTDELFFVIRPGEGSAYELANAKRSAIQCFLERILRDVPTTAFKEMQQRKMDYVSLAVSCMSRELNRKLYLFGKSVCFQQTPVDIALSAFLDKGVFPAETAQKLVKQIMPIHRRRFENLLYQKKPTISIMSIEGCEHFLQTGMSSDHFVGFRAFTPQERLRIFEIMLDAAQADSGYMPLLLKQADPKCRYFVLCYDKLSIVLLKVDTNYDLDGHFDYVLLNFPELTKQYEDAFQNRIIKEGCHSREESLRILRTMMEEYAQTLR